MKKNKKIYLCFGIILIFIMMMCIKIISVYNNTTTPIKLKSLVFYSKKFQLDKEACAYPFICNDSEILSPAIGTIRDTNNKLYVLCISQEYGFILFNIISSTPQIGYFISPKTQTEIKALTVEVAKKLAEPELKE